MNIRIFLYTAIIMAASLQVKAADNQFASKSRWIWFDALKITVGDCYYRKAIDFKDGMESVVLVTYMDDVGEVYFNGKKIAYSITGRGKDNKALVKARKFNRSGKLKPGKNILAVHVNNMRHSGGLMLLGTVIHASGKAGYIHSDKSWKASGTLSENWMSENFDDSKWANAKEFMDVNAKPWADVSEVKNICLTPEEKAAK